MKFLFILAVLFIFPGVGFGQGSALDNEVDSELDQLYAEPVKTKQHRDGARSVSTQRRQTVPTQNIQAPQPIYIVNQATPSSSAVASNNNELQQSQNTSQGTIVQKQPTTFVEASPLVESKAEQMRKSRVDAEAQTETKIVEKLETSRLEDEKRRADVLFGSKFEQLNNQQQTLNSQQQPILSPLSQQVQQPPAVIQPIPVQIVQPTPVPVVASSDKEDHESLSRETIKNEIQSALKAEQEAEVTSIEQKYFTGLVGIPDYPDASNVRGNYSLGATFGTKYDEAYSVEGSFIFSNYNMNPVYNNGFTAPNMDVNQYAASLGLKYFMFTGMVKPFLGGLMQYTYRTYAWSNKNYGYNNYYNNGYYNNNYNNNSESTNSHAVDLGLNVGADIVFNHKFTLGVDYRYFFNLSSRKDNSAFVYQPYYGTPLEQLNASLLSVSAKVEF